MTNDQCPIEFPNGDWRLETGDSKRRGYTLIEILVALTIIGLLFIGGYTGYREYARRQILTNAALDLKNNLTLFRQKALSGDSSTACTVIDPNNNLLGYQVVFAASTYTVSPICAVTDAAASFTQIYTLPQSVTISVTGLSGALKYYTVSGTNVTSNVTITLTHVTGSTKTLTLTSSGVVQ